MKHLIRERIEKGYPNEPLLAATQSKGVVRKEEYENRTVLALKDLHLLKLVRVGDFVISLRSFQGGIEYARHQGIISPAYTIFYPIKTLHHSFFAALFKSKPFIEQLTLFVTGIRQGQNIDFGKLRDSYLPVPPDNELHSISRYLDHADRQIRRFIRAKRRTIELLNEQKQAIIHQAVTRGLDPNVPLKPSGIEWLGDIPCTWSERTIAQVSESLQTGPFGSQVHASDYVDGGIPLINPLHLRTNRIIADSRFSVDEVMAEKLSRHKLQLGDIVLGRRGELGRCGLVTESEVGWLCGTGSIRIRPKLSLIDPEYLTLIISSKRVSAYLSLKSVGATMDNLNTSIVGQIRIPCPPPSEQRQIRDYIHEQSEINNGLILRTQREIDLIREYRTRLIADVVTGKLDVRAAAQQLPDMADEADLWADEPSEEAAHLEEVEEAFPDDDN